MKKFIKSKLIEALQLPSFRLPSNLQISRTDLDKIKIINWSDLGVNDLGGEGNIAHLGITFPFETNASDGIIIDIQVIQGKIYQVHIHMTKELQGLGLGYKIYKALIKDLGHLYSGKGRRQNPIITNIWDKLKTDNDIECYSNKLGDLCMIKANPNKQELLNFIA